MANLILVLGKTGTGKSRSIKNLNPAETYIFNSLGKDLPWQKSRAIYNEENKNVKVIRNMRKEKGVRVTDVMNALVKGKPEVKTIIMDDARHIMEEEFIDRATEIGYTKFTQIGQHMIEILECAKALPSYIDVFVMLHTDDVVSGQAIIGLKAKLVGKLVEDHFDPFEIVTICLMTYVKMDKGKATYHFVTNRATFEGVEYPAKSPEGMFEEILIENDLLFVKQKIHEYYN